MRYTRRLLMAVLLACTVLSLPAGAEMAETPMQSAQAVEVKDMEIVRKTTDFEISVHYPVLGMDGVDVEMARWAEKLALEFERDTAESGRDSGSAPYQLDVSYVVERPSPGVASVVFSLWAYTGGAHGNLGIIVHTYDLHTATPLTFSHIFEDPETALQLMSTYACETLRVELGSDVVEDMLKAGTTPDADNFTALALRPGGVRIHFAPYQVAPWVQGALFVDMPLEALTDARPHLELWGKE